MTKKVLVCYKSVTGFTKRYAEMIAAELNGALRNIKDITADTISQYDIVIFGSRLRAGTVDGLKKIKSILAQSGVTTFVIFATGAMPAAASEAIQQMWEQNLTVGELHKIPHFYMPGGLCYEKMPLSEKIMMKAFSHVMKSRLKHKQNKTKEDLDFERTISASYDNSSKESITPLVRFLREQNEGLCP